MKHAISMFRHVADQKAGGVIFLPIAAALEMAEHLLEFAPVLAGLCERCFHLRRPRLGAGITRRPDGHQYEQQGFRWQSQCQRGWRVNDHLELSKQSEFWANGPSFPGPYQQIDFTAKVEGHAKQMGAGLLLETRRLCLLMGIQVTVHDGQTDQPIRTTTVGHPDTRLEFAVFLSWRE